MVGELAFFDKNGQRLSGTPIGTADRMWTRPNGLRILQKLDLDLKGSRLDAPLLMQKAICELSLARSRA